MSDVIFQPVGPGVWEHTQMISFFGCSVPHRMTIVRLRDGGLLLHSPTRCDRATVQALQALGEIRHIVAPNGMHDLFLQDYRETFPNAHLWIPPGVDKYFAQLRDVTHLPYNDDDLPWRGELSHVVVEGIPRLNECVFYHAPSRSLLLADLLFNIEARHPRAIRIAARLGGFYRKAAMPLDIKWFLVKDRNALGRSIQQILSFPFENIIVGHGANVMGSGLDAFQTAFGWLLGSSRRPGDPAR